MEASEHVIDAETRAQILDAVLRRVIECYVDADVAAKIEAAVRARIDAGQYDGIASGTELSEVLTSQLQAVSSDRHLWVTYSREPRRLAQRDDPTRDEREEFRRDGELTNFGFAKVHRLPGNVGYLRLHAFFPAAVARAGATAVAAMNFIAETSALIVDVRESPGGDPSMVTLLSSYLFAEPVQLTSICLREGGTTNQFWTYDYVAGPRYADKPIYVLTGPGTLSAAEGFVYTLKRLRRATIVGETTGGAAHVTSIIPLDPHFAVSVPFGCAVDPITGTTWEGTGVAPDIEVPSPQALTVAHRAALKDVIATLAGQPSRACDRLVQEARAELAKLGRPTPGNPSGAPGGR